MLKATALIDLILPASCLLCSDQAARDGLCLDCHADLPWLDGPHCPRCAIPTPLGEVCGDCLQHPPAFDRSYAALCYQWPVDALIGHLKYGGDWSLAHPLGAWLAHIATADHGAPDCLIAMPLHPARQKLRGFNQSLEIAKVLARQWRRPIHPSIERLVDTPSAAGAHREDRARQVKGAFRLRQPLSGQRVVLVDDVMTTGATANECAAAIKAAGAAEVEVWVVARTLKRGGMGNPAG